ncbi:MAG: hypothetical protein GC162_07220 [Planctomycetes bacterium]|nr:hypothetical protein [Planctomycetota bacterium]
MAEEWRAKPVRIAGIDVGSNGIRLIIGEVDVNGAVRAIQSTREAVRLGADAFDDGIIKPDTIAATVAAFTKFKQTMEQAQVQRMRAVATSAARESKNARELIAAIDQATGLKLELIDPLEEAQLVFHGVASAVDVNNKTAVMIDMGGGSVEVTVTRDRLALGCESLRIGPVRLMKMLAAKGLTEADAEPLIARYKGSIAELVRTELSDSPADLCVGTGGNIVRMGQLRTQLFGKTKSYKFKPAELDLLITRISAMSVADRVSQLGMRPDRADVIVLSMMVMRMIMAEIPIPRVIVPGVGLKEGLLWHVAHRYYPV